MKNECMRAIECMPKLANPRKTETNAQTRWSNLCANPFENASQNSNATVIMGLLFDYNIIAYNMQTKRKDAEKQK